jgi:protein involved in polysaccharide export with SLBB domain
MERALTVAAFLLALCAPSIAAHSLEASGRLQEASGRVQTPSPQEVQTPTESAPQSAASSADDFYKLGLTNLEAKKYEQAVVAFKRSVRLKDDADTHYHLGMAYFSLNRYSDAANSYKQAIRLKPQWPEARFRLGWMYYVLGRKQSAEEQYKALQELNSPLAATLGRILKEPRSGDEKTSTGPAQKSASIVKTEEATGSGREANSDTPAKPAASNDPTQPSTATTDSAPQARDAGSSSLPPIAATNASPNAPAQSVKQNGDKAEDPPSNPDSRSAETATDLSSKKNVSNPRSTEEAPPTSIYRIAAGDVLDIRLQNALTTRSTLYTVMDGGAIEYPLAGGQFLVGGLTTPEIETRLAEELKRRSVQQDPRVNVSVREYTSHSVIVSGLVATPGARILHREAVPLYVVLAEAQPRADAGRAAIMRASGQTTVDLSDPTAINVLVYPGDVITVMARVAEYYYIAGKVFTPGQKSYQSGITLLQAILTAGGLTRSSENAVTISREGTDGRLSTTRYSLKEIRLGKIPDPRLKPGDRIEVGPGK